MSYPVNFEMDYVEQRSRLTTFFRPILAILHLIVLGLYGFVAEIAVFLAWFALLFTGRWPEGLYDFVGGYLRYTARVYGYLFLGTDVYPAYGGAPDDNYPVRYHLPPAQPEYNRMRVLFRIILIIPAAIIAWLMTILAELAAFVSWFVIVFTGRQPQGLQDAIKQGVSYVMRANAWFFLITETAPPFEEEPSASAPPPAAAPPSATPPPPPPPPSA